MGGRWGPLRVSPSPFVAPRILVVSYPVVSLALGQQLTLVADVFQEAPGAGSGPIAFADCIGYSMTES